MTRAEQAVNGLTVLADGGIVLVDDGCDRWLCREVEYDIAYAAMDRMPPFECVDGDEAEAECSAYAYLCAHVHGPIASRIGTSSGDYEQLVRDAVACDLISDLDAAAYGVIVGHPVIGVDEVQS